MLTNSQETAYRIIKSWVESGGKLFKLGGPAGSGKSFLIGEIAELVGIDDCLLMTPTGKAANNLQKRGLYAQTIHSTIYKVRENELDQIEDEDEWNSMLKNSPEMVEKAEAGPKFRVKSPDSFPDTKLFIIDEGSMVGGSLLKDILSFNVPTLLVGDPNQLQPVNDTTVYQHCDFYLSEIVRQASDSPVIWLSQKILNGDIPVGSFGTSMVRRGKPTDDELQFASVVLTDTNARRAELNAHLRKLYLGDVEDWVTLDDRVICRTNYALCFSDEGFMLMNGTQGVVSEIRHCNPRSAILSFDNLDLGRFTWEFTNNPLSFPPKKRPPFLELGYALTVHLSQGSEWANVIYDLAKGPNKRALYTGVTRAKESVLITL